jgi:hypothetical protein
LFVCAGNYSAVGHQRLAGGDHCGFYEGDSGPVVYSQRFSKLWAADGHGVFFM